MRASLFKYIEQHQDAQGRALWWPGSPDGFPYRGPRPPATTDDEYENLGVTGDFQHKMFHMDSPDDCEAYQQIMDRIVNGWFVLRDREKRWIEKRQCYAIYVEWVELYSVSTKPAGPYSTQGASDGRVNTLSARSILDIP